LLGQIFYRVCSRFFGHSSWKKRKRERRERERERGKRRREEREEGGVNINNIF